MLVEMPPRARRRGVAARDVHGGDGNTSACAEKRRAATTDRWPDWKYLRVRGEELRS